MLMRDKQRVRRYLESCAAAEAQQLVDAAGADSDGASAADKAGGTLGSTASDDIGKGHAGEYAKAAVLPWWLPPEDIPARYSAECGASGVVHGKTTVATRKRLLAVGTTGQAVWASSEHYAVLLTTAGPPPSGCVCVGGRGRLGARLSVAVTSCVVPGERKDRCGLRGTVDRGVPACGCPPQLAVAPASPAFRLTQLCAGGWRPDGASRRRRSRRGRS
jgi:hypothetical protein